MGAGHHTGTFRGNQLAMATGLTTLKILKDQNIASKVAAQGEWLKGQLKEMAKRYPVIGHVRGLGMMIGIEIVKPHEAADHMGCFPGDGEAVCTDSEEVLRSRLDSGAWRP